MSYTNKTLVAGEEVLATAKRSMRPTVFFVLLTCWTGFTVLAVPFMMVVRWATEMKITNKRIVRRTGIIFRKTHEVKCDAIEGVHVDQSVLGRLLGYGDVVISGRGIGQVAFKTVNSPLKIRQQLAEI